MKKLSAIVLLASCFYFQDSRASAGDSIFNSSLIHTIKFYFSQAKWYDSLIAYKPLDKKMKGNAMVDGVMYNNVGVQFKGNSSFNNPSKKKSWKIDFNEYDTLQEWNKEKTINLNNGFKDPTMLREKINLDFCVRNGIAAPRCTYTNVYVNDTLYGLYTIVEEIDKTFLKHWYADNNGNLFKGDPNGTLQWYGSNVSSYNTKYELKTNKTINNWSDIIHLIDKINNTPAANLHDSLDAAMQTNSFINAWAANILFSNLDSYQGSGHNYYVFHDSTYNKFNWITWDVNEAFGNFSQGMTVAQMENLSIFYIPNPATNRPLENKMLANSTYKGAYIWELCNLVATEFDSTIINPRIDSLANRIRTSVYADPNKFYTNTQFEANINSNITSGFNIPGLKPFLGIRRASVLTELAANGCLMGINESSVYGLQFSVNPNPNNGQFTINGDKFPVQVQVYNSLGQIINETTLNNKLETVNLKQPSGIYFYRTFSDEHMSSSGKIIIE